MGSVPLAVFAPAKINLYLHVLGRRADGYHLLDSLVAFADIGDRIEAVPAARLSLTLTGPEASALRGIDEHNLVMRAARLLAAAIVDEAPRPEPPGAALRLEKCLPVSSGIGGGSSDAAATLRALRRLWNRPLSGGRLAALAVTLGADVPACLAAGPVWVGGIGEHLDPADDLPSAGILLANPRRPLPTAEVFRRRKGPFGAEARFASMPGDAAGLATMLRTRGNDLTEAAVHLVPEIASVLDRLSSLPGALIARMSGSGATCFALFADREAAVAAHAELAAAESEWWSAAGALLGAHGDAPAIALYKESAPDA